MEARGGNSWFTDGAVRFAHNGLDDIRRIIPEMDEEEAGRIDIPPYPPEDFVSDLARMSNGRVDPRLAETLARESLPTMEWLRDLGMRFAMIYDNQAFLRDGMHRFWGGLAVKSVGRGIGLVDSLFRHAEDLGVDVRYDARCVGLEREADGWALSISTPEGPTQVGATNVVLACGGFEADEEMRVRHLGPDWTHALVRGTEHNVGDGLRMAASQGAVRAGAWDGCHAIATDAEAPAFGDRSVPGDVFKKHSYPLGIIVNRDGYRFLDEGKDLRNYTYAAYGKAVLGQPEGVAYQIFDQQVTDLLREEYRRPEATRVTADTLRELADRLGIPAEALERTVEEFNDAVVDGPFNPEKRDGKHTDGIDPPKSNWALRLEQPPFEAFPVRCAITFTFGGVLVDAAGRMLDDSGAVIQGLYAAGEMVGGLFFDNYPGGAGLMSGATFGRLAGSDAGRSTILSHGNTPEQR